jgi:hypothetical protein
MLVRCCCARPTCSPRCRSATSLRVGYGSSSRVARSRTYVARNQQTPGLAVRTLLDESGIERLELVRVW